MSIKSSNLTELSKITSVVDPKLYIEQKTIPIINEQDAKNEAKAWVDRIYPEGWQCAGIFGLSFAYHIEELVRKYPERKFIIIEPFIDRLNELITMRDITGLLKNENLYFVFGGTQRDIAVNVNRIVFDNKYDHDFVLLSWDPYVSVHSDYYAGLYREINDSACQFIVNRVTAEYHDTMWIENTFRNINKSVQDPSVSELYGVLPVNIPAIIVASGPSLDKNIKKLVKAKDRALIIAAGSAIRPLLKAGVTPDLAITFDGKPENVKHYKGIDLRNVNYVYCPCVTPEVLDCLSENRFVSSLNTMEWITWLYGKMGREIGVLESGPSVVNVACSLAKKMGCNPIIFVGLDLSFTEMNYAKDIATCKPVLNRTNLVDVEGINGKKVWTNIGMYSMKIFIEQEIVSSGLKYIDATEGGAKIAGTENMFLDKAIKKYCLGRTKDNLSERIKNVYRKERVYEKDISKVKKLIRDELVDAEFLAFMGKKRKDYVYYYDKIGKKESYRYLCLPLMNDFVKEIGGSKSKGIFDIIEKRIDQVIRLV